MTRPSDELLDDAAARKADALAGWFDESDIATITSMIRTDLRDDLATQDSPDSADG